MNKLKSILKKIGDVMMFCLGLGGKTETGKKAESDGLCDFGGQGRGEDTEK